MFTKDVIKSRREHLGMTQQSLADAVGVTRAAVQQWERGDTAPTRKHQPRLAETLGISVAELMHPENQARQKNTITKTSISVFDTATLHIPHYDTAASMGRGITLRDQPGVIRGWEVTEEWLAKNARNYTSVKNLCLVTGFGDSMVGLFNSGDPILIDTGIKEHMGDAIYFFRVEDEGFIKRLQKVPGVGLRVISQNKEYETWTITAGMDYQILGKVVKFWEGKEH